MNVPMRRVREFLDHTWVVLALTILSAIASLLAVYQVFGAQLLWLGLSAVGILTLLAAVIYSIRIRQENLAFRRLPEHLHRVNHGYRNVLSALFGDTHVVPTEEEMRKAERKTLESVCQKISAIFSALTHVPCTVTIKFIYKDENDRAVCRTLVRSETESRRDEGRPEIYELQTGENTAFDRCMVCEPGITSNFHSDDLIRERDAGRYRNQRTNWERFYVSAIVVPIRYVNLAKLGQPGASDYIGFLAVDTTSPNRLNGTYHVELLASFADQVYNFMSLMRGKYAVPPARDERIARA
jgi:hypothetical protein